MRVLDGLCATLFAVFCRVFKQCSVGSGSVWQWQCQWQCSVTHFLFFSDRTSKILVDFAIFFKKIRGKGAEFRQNSFNDDSLCKS